MPVKAIHCLLRGNLALKKNERLLVFTDKITAREKSLTEADRLRRLRLRDVVYLTAETARGLCKKAELHEYPALGGHGKEPPESLWRMAFGEAAVDALKSEGLLGPIRNKKAGSEMMEAARKIIRRNKRQAVDVVVALSNYSTSHTTFRSLLTEAAGARYASMPLFDIAMFDGPMRAEYKEMAKRTRAVASALGKSVSVRITTPLGTDISFETRGRRAKADTGVLTKEGSFGNLPAGEAYLAPVEGTANGRLVIEWGPTHKLDSPVTVTVKDGMAEEVMGDDPYAEELRERLSRRRDNRNIAELGVGTNELAVRPDNILESEKILGTVHIAFGDNASFGGTVKTPYHQDFVYFKPTVEMTLRDGSKAKLLKDGKLLV